MNKLFNFKHFITWWLHDCACDWILSVASRNTIILSIAYNNALCILVMSNKLLPYHILIHDNITLYVILPWASFI